MWLLKQFFVETALFRLTPSPLSLFVTILFDPPPSLDRWHTLWMAPKFSEKADVINR